MLREGDKTFVAMLCLHLHRIYTTGNLEDAGTEVHGMAP